ncbi:MAG: hypothetical protein HGA65_08015 [Oscillochloris sp.]|nr:hypothetical protein [Oscillochloris sp.]
MFDSYQVALEDAQANFSPNVKLYALVPSQIMQRNLGQLPVMPGWFFKFKVEGLPREYIVLVINGQSAGVTEAEPVVQVLPLDLPIDMSAVKISSDQVLAGFLKKAPELGLTVTDPFTYDLELVNLEGQSGPVWSVYDPISLKWLYAMSATTGEELPNPRS